MTWERKVVNHVCPKPTLIFQHLNGSIWRCDECHTRYIADAGRWRMMWFQRKRKYRKGLK